MANITKFNNIIADSISAPGLMNTTEVDKIINQYENPYYEQTVFKVIGSDIILEGLYGDNVIIHWGDGSSNTASQGIGHTYSNPEEVHYITLSKTSGVIDFGSPFVSTAGNGQILFMKLAGDIEPFYGVQMPTDSPNTEIWYTPEYAAKLTTMGYTRAGTYRIYGPMAIDLDAEYNDAFLSCATKIYCPISVLSEMNTYIHEAGDNGQTIEVIPMLTRSDNADLAQVIENSGNSQSAISATYSTLRTWKQAGALIPGQYYIVNDYTATTVQPETRSAGHIFPLLIQAISTNKFDEKCTAIVNNIATMGLRAVSSWEIKYCFDNNADRFAWADTSNGKGVIYYMKDEWSNEAPYDFKNIQFKRYKLTYGPTENFLDAYFAYPNIEDQRVIGVDYDDYKWCYTFSGMLNNGDVIDLTTSDLTDDTQNAPGVYNNVIKPLSYCATNNVSHFYKTALNNIVFMYDAWYDEFFYGCYNNHVDCDCFNITIGDCNNTIIKHNSKEIILFTTDNTSIGGDNYATILANSSYNKIGNACNNNIFVNSENNTLGSNCYNNTFVESSNNILADHCCENSFDMSGYNALGMDCWSNNFSNGANCNILGASCVEIELLNDTCQNTFDVGCYDITLDSDCYYNTFDTNCATISMSNGSYHNVFGNGSSYIQLCDYCQYIIVEPGCYTIALISSESVDYGPISGIHIHAGVHGASIQNPLSINKHRSDGEVWHYYPNNVSEVYI